IQIRDKALLSLALIDLSSGVVVGRKDYIGLFRRVLVTCEHSDHEGYDHHRDYGRPEPEEDFKKKATRQEVHFLCFLADCAYMYPTPRTVFIRCASPTRCPSFLRKLLMCMSMVRSKGVELRPRTSFVSSSRVTIRPAARSSLSSRSYSTTVSSIVSPARRTTRVPVSISTSPTRISRPASAI